MILPNCPSVAHQPVYYRPINAGASELRDGSPSTVLQEIGGKFQGQQTIAFRMGGKQTIERAEYTVREWLLVSEYLRECDRIVKFGWGL